MRQEGIKEHPTKYVRNEFIREINLYTSFNRSLRLIIPKFCGDFVAENVDEDVDVREVRNGEHRAEITAKGLQLRTKISRSAWDCDVDRHDTGLEGNRGNGPVSGHQ